jgi:DNA-directed RNA polymerase specialized sigma24 family protein
VNDVGRAVICSAHACTRVRMPPFRAIAMPSLSCTTAMGRRTAEQQQVIRMKFIQGHDSKSIAHAMNKRTGTARALQLRALQSLRRELERQDEWEA